MADEPMGNAGVRMALPGGSCDYTQSFREGDPVSKVTGDYHFDGWVVGIITKRSKVLRYAVEDDRGVVHIFAARQLRIRVETMKPETGNQTDGQ